jgi:hypothetical protein
MNWIKRVVSAVFGLFSRIDADDIIGGIRKAAPYVSLALNLSATAASIVGGPLGKTVAGVLAVADRFGVPVLIRPDATDAEIGTAIRDAIARAIVEKFPGAKLADINRAIELAYGAVRNP